jgi:dsDNA-specific endonuclease/ATPase MutS2
MWWTAKTRVSPKAGVAFVDGKHLRAGSAGDGGHITEVRAQNQTCTLSADSLNVEVNICSSSKVTACQ